MTPAQACNFLVTGLVMIAGPAVWAEHFGANQMGSASWLVLMGGLQAVGGLGFLLVDGLNRLRRVAARIGESLETSVSLADLHRAALPESFYALVEEPEEVALARRLQRQLLRLA